MPDAIYYYSTNKSAPKVNFQQALLQGQAPDRGLYMPERIPEISKETIDAFADMDYCDIAYDIAIQFLRGEVDEKAIKEITRSAYNYPVPLENVCGKKFVMRLDQGPTASFKDFAARMMARLMEYFLKRKSRRLLILTATSGDTGSAVANAFYGLENIEIAVLFPLDEVSALQRKQMTTLRKNVKILGLSGKFDDCQALVKQAFSDPDLQHLGLSSANSINFGRLLPQTMYYFYSYAKLSESGEPVVFSVPSGNFGDLMGGLIAASMGLPVKKFVVATNENDEFPKFVASGDYSKIEPSRNCLSSAMNVGHPSNLARLIDMYGGHMDEKGNISKPPDMEKIRRDIYPVSIDDKTTEKTIAMAYDKYRLLLEPHGATGWAGLDSYPADDEQLCISLETAHPAKFPEQITDILGIEPPLPRALEGLANKPESYEKISKDYSDFKKYLRDNFEK